MIGSNFYRIYYSAEGYGFYAERWKVVEETEKTVIIELYGERKRVLKNGEGKRFAYAKMEDALTSYVARKQRYAQRLERILIETERSLDTLSKNYTEILNGLKTENGWVAREKEEGLFF